MRDHQHEFRVVAISRMLKVARTRCYAQLVQAPWTAIEKAHLPTCRFGTPQAAAQVRATTAQGGVAPNPPTER